MIFSRRNSFSRADFSDIIRAGVRVQELGSRDLILIMNLPKEQVEWVAKLAYIEVSEDDKEKYANDLSAVLGYVDELQQVDTNSVDETMQVTNLSNVMEGDFVVPSNIPREEFLKRAPQSSKGYIAVKNVFRR